MTDANPFKGVIAPVLTPFDDDGRADAARFVSHAKWLLGDGCHGLAVFGTTGEATSLGMDERESLLEALVDSGVDPKTLMVGTGLASLPDTVDLTNHALGLGTGGILLLPPFYYKAVSDDGLFAYVSALIEQVADDRLKIYLYHIPPVANVGYSPELVARLIDAFPDVIVGLKDSSGDWSYSEHLIKSHPGFDIFSGSESFLLQNLRTGGAGCITASGNVNARAIRDVYDNWQTDEADGLQERITAMRATIQARPMIPMLKAIVAHYRNDPGWTRLRPPFMPLDAAEAEAGISELAESYGLTLEAA